MNQKLFSILKKIRFKLSLCFIIMLMVGFSSCSLKEKKKSTGETGRPNVLIIMADQWRMSAFGHRGNPDIITPNLDKLAKEGEVFMNAVSGMPVCTPARASILTGQQPLTNGVFMNDVLLDTNAVTLGKVMNIAGYHTAFIGKWHLDGQYRSRYIPPGDRRQGFKYWKVLNCTHNYNHSIYYANSPDTLLWEGYDAIAQAKDASKYIKAHAKDNMPFLLFLSWGPPHNPYHTAPEQYKALYDPEKLQLRPNVPIKMKEQVQYDLAGYYAHCTALDSMVGMLRKTLKETNIEKNTIILFVSDHGDLLGSHAYYRKQQPYDESIRIPMIFFIPEKLGGKSRKLDAMINLVDVMPTILGLTSIEKPESIEGIDYSGYLKGDNNPGDTVTMISCVQPFGAWNKTNGGKEYRGLRSYRYTYVKDLKGPWLFFDNLKDPYQMTNLIEKKEYEDIVSSFDRLLEEKLRKNNDHFLPGNAYVKIWKYPRLDKTGTVPYY